MSHEPTISTVLEELNKLSTKFDRGIEGLEQSLEQRFEAINKRFDTHDEFFESINEHFHDIDERFDIIESTMATKALVYSLMFNQRLW